MRILIHDYSGHSFQVELSRHLAARGHRVRHVYSAAVETPRGPLAPAPDDPAGFDVAPLATGRTLAKYRPLARIRQEDAYARHLARAIRDMRPDAVLSGNCSPLIQARAARAAHRVGAGFVIWLQDLYAPALRDALRRWSRPAAAAAAPLAERVEAAVLRAGDAVVPVAPAFAERAVAAGVDPSLVRTIGNWAPPLAVPADGGAAWRAKHGLGERTLFVYAGTLGQKHDPELIAALARHWREDPGTAVVVASQGPGRTHLDRVRAAESLTNLHLLDFLPHDELAHALAGADVVLAVLSQAGGGYAVPSKVLTAMRAGRPVLAAMPPDNAASAALADAGAGVVVPPGDRSAWLAEAERLHRDSGIRARLGANGAAHAEREFAIASIGARFLEVLDRARDRQSVTRRDL